ncbi:divergent protein kinase domain 2A-like isoform X2 [Anneissia japonica]|nr:divergent protein kinase domain 2A-like isoform X2 [Anneissia japonica]XP_033107183.1 divergent protein kinase domain 2A-like isoform X2 [Anneissia japonica]XP_033107184.1 divergent protein kinase domain 2A-like isoform X2 [Anneissia japonica]XP_033107185.1 divergent protein kinase domain 2A-like isoform X2 [Anneissia japonica]
MKVWSQRLDRPLNIIKKRKSIIALTLFVFCIIYMKIYYVFSKNQLQNFEFLESRKCPACYGTSLCGSFQRGELDLESFYKFRLLDVVNVKNVFFGRHQEKSVVFKKLGHNTELKKLDEKICKKANLEPSCDLSRVIFQTDLTNAIKDGKIHVDAVKGLSDIVRCPSQRLLDRIWSRYQERSWIGGVKHHQQLNLITTLLFNPEPLILQTFPKTEGWPFPEYEGACGRFIVEENIGPSLGTFFHHPWEERVKLAYQLTELCERLTNNNDDYALYLTDVTYDNFAVAADGSVYVIDAENIVVVDKKKIRNDKPADWDVALEAINDDCKGVNSDCLMFSPDLLCSRLQADHNYFALCHAILGPEATHSLMYGGLLHDIPGTVLEKQQLLHLLAECQQPKERYGRFKAFPALMALLKKLAEESR